MEILIGEFEQAGSHHTFENYDTKRVDACAPHKIYVKRGQSADDVAMVAAHEAYHLFYSIRHLITADEEAQAEVFGCLVRWIYGLAKP